MTDRDTTIRRASRFWWVFLLRGLVGLLLGVSVLVGGEHAETLWSFIAAYWLAGALLTIRWVLANRWRPGSRLAIAAALTGVLAACLVLASTVFDDAVPVTFTLGVLGVTALLTGGLRLFGAFHDDDESVVGRHRAKRIVLGTLEVVLGVVLLSSEERTSALVLAAAGWGLVGGTVLLLDAIALRRLAKGSSASHGGPGLGSDGDP